MAQSFEVVFRFDAKDEGDAEAISALMREAVENVCYIRMESLAYTYDGQPLLMDEHYDFYDVVLIEPGDKIINVIKEVRFITSYGLKEAKDLVDSTRKPHGKEAYVLREVKEKEAREAVSALEGAGAMARLEKSRLTKREIDEAKKGLLRTMEFLTPTERQT